MSNGLSSFGILLTGRLELRNELLSALSLGKVGAAPYASLHLPTPP